MAIVRALAIALCLLLSGLPARADALKHIDNATLAELIGRGVPVIDIRTPPEWAQTGSIKGAHRIMAFDERGKLAPDFIERLAKVAGPNDEIALICRTGNRTTQVQRYLQSQGFTQVYNVKEGMAGSAAGPGWLKRGLPVETCTSQC